jgi:CRISPR-associated protein Csx10
MKEYQLDLELLSPTLAGSGVGFGAEINTDVVFNDLGMPFIPAKRLKGCLRDAALEVQEMFEAAGIAREELRIEDTFGRVGDKSSAPVYFSNLYLEGYAQNQAWLRYFTKAEKYKRFISPERILVTFTEVRQQTQINDEGAAFDQSLRTIRVLRKGLKFYGEVRIASDDEHILNTLLFACRNLRRFGTKRNRGFGEVRCTLLTKDGQFLSIDERVEDLCIA